MSAVTLKNDSEKKGKITGWHVLGALVTFFGLIIIANIAFIYFAVQSHRGEDVPKSYRQGLEYNQVLRNRASQAELGWTVTVSEAFFEGSDQILIEITDQEKRAVAIVDFDITLRHPADADLDHDATIIRRGNGQILLDTSGLEGRWIVKGQSRSVDHPFRFQAEIEL